MVALYAYGNRAAQALRWLHRGDVFAAGSSDLDLAVSGCIDRRYSLAEKVALASAFSDLFEFEMIDLADMAEVDPFVAANIVRGERLYCSDRMYAEELDLYVLRRAGDLAPFERDRMAAIESATQQEPTTSRIESFAGWYSTALGAWKSPSRTFESCRWTAASPSRSTRATCGPPSHASAAHSTLCATGRHLLAKLATTGEAEYRAVGRRLREHAVLDAETADLLVKLAGYRNRQVTSIMR